jgi:hypothetical protein
MIQQPGQWFTETLASPLLFLLRRLSQAVGIHSFVSPASMWPVVLRRILY